MQRKRIDEPCSVYDSLLDIWTRCRAFSRGEAYVKALDVFPSPSYDNVLIPFSPTMSLEQYSLYKQEAELPGITAMFVKILVGGLLRKPPVIDYNIDVSDDVKNWIQSSISIDGGSMIAFLDGLLFEELQTSRAWVFVDYPAVDENVADKKTIKDWEAVKPFPVIWSAESVINWHTTIVDGQRRLSRVIVRGYTERFSSDSEFHPVYIDTIWVHELVDGAYQTRIFESMTGQDPVAVSGKIQVTDTTGFQEVGDPIVHKMHGESIPFIPAWPINGSIECSEPLITTFVTKEAALYNVLSRRNHLLYGAATYTPYIASDMSNDDFSDIVKAGLGSWLKIQSQDTIGVLATPTEALKDLAEAIRDKFEEMAKLGVRFLAPENEASGVALQLRNAAQTATIGTLNTKISSTMRDILAFMINRRYSNMDVKPGDIEFSLAPDFDPAIIGHEYLKLATEWYEKHYLPRSEWLRTLKANDMLSTEYDDDEAKDEINNDELLQPTMAMQENGMSTARKIVDLKRVGKQPLG